MSAFTFTCQCHQHVYLCRIPFVFPSVLYGQVATNGSNVEKKKKNIYIYIYNNWDVAFIMYQITSLMMHCLRLLPFRVGQGWPI